MGLSGLWLVLLVIVGATGEEEPRNAEAASADTAEAADGDAGQAAGRETPEPREMPDFTGQNLAVAIDAAEAAGYHTTSHDATEGDAGQFLAGNWTVCFQDPEAGTDIRPGDTIDFAVVHEGQRCPAADGLAVLAPTVPSVVELPYAEAVERLAEEELTDVEARSSYRDVELPEDAGAYEDWIVCFQHPHAGEEIANPERMTVRLSLVEPDTGCPAADNERLHPEPDPDPEPDPAPDLTSGGGGGGSSGGGGGSSGGSGGSSGGSGGSSGGSGSSGGATYYQNCDAVRAAGAAPLYVGEPGYSRRLDRDGDGVACE